VGRRAAPHEDLDEPPQRAVHAVHERGKRGLVPGPELLEELGLVRHPPGIPEPRAHNQGLAVFCVTPSRARRLTPGSTKKHARGGAGEPWRWGRPPYPRRSRLLTLVPS